MTFQLQENIFRELISRKLHITYLFVIQRMTWTNCLGVIFLENLISVTLNNVSRVIFAISSGRSVHALKYKFCIIVNESITAKLSRLFELVSLQLQCSYSSNIMQYQETVPLRYAQALSAVTFTGSNRFRT